MCLIIKKPANVLIEVALIERAITQNKDGWGIMWAADGTVNTIKGFGLDDLLAAIDTPSFAASEGFVHFRWGTSGKVNDENCHPFRVTSHIYMMHNGVFNVNTPQLEMSDTWHFVKRYLRPMLVAFPKAFLDTNWVDDLEWFVGTNKVVILNSQGEFGIINEKLWHKRDGLLLSNLNSCHTPSTIVYSKQGYWSSSDIDAYWENKSHNQNLAKSITSGNSCVIGSAFVDINKETAPVVEPKKDVSENVGNSVVCSLEASLDEEYDSRYKNRKFASQVAQELRDRGVQDDSFDHEFDEDSEEAEKREELQDYLATRSSPAVSLRNLQSLDYEDIKAFCLSEPEAVAAMIWRSEEVFDDYICS